jgi:hypothetical protein
MPKSSDATSLGRHWVSGNLSLGSARADLQQQFDITTAAGRAALRTWWWNNEGANLSATIDDLPALVEASQLHLCQGRCPARLHALPRPAAPFLGR